MKEKKYLRIYRYLRKKIEDGDYGNDARLPSKRDLAQMFGVSVITVEHAYDILCQEGYAVSKERKGYFTDYRKETAFASALSMPEHVLQTTGTAAEVTFPFSVLAKTARFILSEYAEHLLARTESAGALFLRETISDYLARSRGMHVSPEQIIIGSGAQNLYQLLVLLLGREKKFACESPSYEKIFETYAASGVNCELLPLHTDGIAADALQRTSADVLHITPYRSYPSGVTASASKRREYLAWVQEGERYIVEDDFSSEFTVSSKVDDTLFSMDKTGRIIYINTFTATISPAIRTAYAVLPPELAARYYREFSFFSCSVPTFEQYLVAELIRRGEFERHVNRMRRHLRKEK